MPVCCDGIFLASDKYGKMGQFWLWGRAIPLAISAGDAADTVALSL